MNTFQPRINRLHIMTAIVSVVPSFVLHAQSTLPADPPENVIQVTATVPKDNTNNGQNPPPPSFNGNIATGGRLGILGEQKSLNVPFTVISYTSQLIKNQQDHTLAVVEAQSAC